MLATADAYEIAITCELTGLEISPSAFLFNSEFEGSWLNVSFNVSVQPSEEIGIRRGNLRFSLCKDGEDIRSVSVPLSYGYLAKTEM